MEVRNQTGGPERKISRHNWSWAAIYALDGMKAHFRKVRSLQAFYEKRLREEFPFTEISGENIERSPYISNIAFKGFHNISLLMNLDMAGIAVAVGSACNSGSIQPSHVLWSMRLFDGIIRGAIRFNFSYQTKQDELEYVIDQLHKIFARLQGGSKHA